MFALVRRLQTQRSPDLLHLVAASAATSSCQQLRSARFEASSNNTPQQRRRRPRIPVTKMKRVGDKDDKSEWWIVDGEMHEIGDNVPLRERFVIPRDNIPNKRRKQLREQFMRRTRLVLKESEHEPWCKRYLELYNELRENWERLYWDEGYSKKIALDHANYDSAEDDDADFSPYRSNTRSYTDQVKDQGFVRSNTRQPPENWGKVRELRDKFEHDRDRRMRDKAFAPMRMDSGGNDNQNAAVPRNQLFDKQRYFSDSDDEED